MKIKQHSARQRMVTLGSLIAVAIFLTTNAQNVRAQQWSTAANGNDIYKTNTAGNVGIGTTSPDTNAKVHVYNASGAGMDIQSANTGSWSRLRLVTATHTYGWFTGDASQPDAPNKLALVDYTAGAFRMVIDSSGNVGIGTTSPSDLLHLSSSANTNIRLTHSDANSTSNALYFNEGGTVWGFINQRGSTYTSFGELGGQFNVGNLNASGATALFAGGANRLQLTSGGNVGIGIINPGYKLEVNGAINATGLNINGSPITNSQWTTSGSNINYATAGNVGIGTGNPTYKLHVTGDGRFTGNLTVDGNIAAKYQDVAEWVPSSEQLPPATVVVLDATKSNQVVRSTQAYDTRVAGVVSQQPGIALGEGGDGKVLVATTGRVLVKVDATNGPIHIGDLLVTSDIPGVAMKSEPIKVGGRLIHTPGTLIGKALEPLQKGSGKILVLLSLQ